MEKYKQVEQWIVQELHEKAYQVGQKFLGEMEIAKVTGVSRQTVRQAIGNLERRGLLLRRQGSGTYVAKRSVQPRASKNIGVISTYASDYIFPHIIAGIQETLSAHGYAMQLFITNNQADKEAQALRQMLPQVDALIVEPVHSALPTPNKILYEQIRAQGIPLIFFNARYPRMEFPVVAMDDMAAGCAAAEHLIRAGHTSIAGLFKSDDRQGHLRCEGFIQAMNRAGLPIPAGQVLWYQSGEIQSFFGGEGLMAALGDCTAVVCYNDEIALHTVAYLKARGRAIPRDISVIGLDNADLASFSDPQLTTIDHPKRQLGITAATHILSWLQQGKEPKSTYFEPRLVVRQSVASRKK